MHCAQVGRGSRDEVREEEKGAPRIREGYCHTLHSLWVGGEGTGRSLPSPITDQGGRKSYQTGGVLCGFLPPVLFRVFVFGRRKHISGVQV